ncbi:hypothetical protein GCM10009566_59070 [Streptomyces murinus]|uniref:Uncharacterized protein n=1 Tax=Streptomyces murinus TaxID=33900 RepID=A0A7W3NV86_STRMR|nr:hypothetical protein [Streptomyces murinus]
MTTRPPARTTTALADAKSKPGAPAERANRTDTDVRQPGGRTEDRAERNGTTSRYAPTWQAEVLRTMIGT